MCGRLYTLIPYRADYKVTDITGQGADLDFGGGGGDEADDHVVEGAAQENVED